jgi:hypothetical protein
MSLLFTAHLLKSWDQIGHGAPKIFRGALERRGAQFGDHYQRFKGTDCINFPGKNMYQAI